MGSPTRDDHQGRRQLTCHYSRRRRSLNENRKRDSGPDSKGSGLLLFRGIQCHPCHDPGWEPSQWSTITFRRSLSNGVNHVPTYSYRCKSCGNAFDIHQSFTDDPLTVCEACGGELRKLFNSVGVVFKGSGFYRNDSRSKSNGLTATDSKSSDSAPASSTSTSSSTESSKSSASSGGSSASTAAAKA